MGCANADTQCEREVRDVMDAFHDAGIAVAEYACREEATASGEAITGLQSASDAAVASACEFGADDRDGASLLATAAEDGFLEGETCSCASASTVVRISTEGAIRSAVRAARGGQGDSTPWTQIIEDVRRYSEEHCAPGTDNGVLDQSAEECAVLSSGNATAASRNAGASVFGESDCTVDAARAAASLARATASAIAEAERACSFSISFTCSLRDVHVHDIALAQLAGFAEGFVDSGCSCDVNTTAMVQRLQPALASLAVDAHSAVCQSGQSDFTDIAAPLAGSYLPPLTSELPASCEADAPTPGQTGTRPAPSQQAKRVARVYPYNQCGGNDYARDLADRNAKLVAPAIASACCVQGYECVVKSRWYAGCRVQGEAAPEGWNGTVLTHESCGS